MANHSDLQYCELTNHGIISVSGKDRKKFLQGQVTCDMDKLSQTRALYGGYANIQGRLIGIFYAIEKTENTLLSLPEPTIGATINTLKKYAVFSKVSFDQPNLGTLAIFGETALTQLEALFNIEISNIKTATETADGLQIIRTVSDKDSFLIIGESKKISALKNMLTAITAEASQDEWQQFLISENICELNRHSIEKFLPSEINVAKLGGVAFNKGCFMGQEIIARMHYLGKSKKSLKQVQISSENVPDIITTARIIDENNKLAGEIAAICQTDKNQAVALAIMLNSKLNTASLAITDPSATITVL